MLATLMTLTAILITKQPTHNMAFFYRIIPTNTLVFHLNFLKSKEEPCSPVVEDNILYQGLYNGLILSQDIENKKILWEYHTYGSPTSLSIYNKILIATTLNGMIYALNKSNGHLIWSYNTQKEIISRAVIYNNTLFVQTTMDNLYAFDASTGSLNWQYAIKNLTGNLTVYATPSPYVSDGMVYTGFSDGEAVALNANTGAVVWDKKPPTTKGFQDIITAPSGNSKVVVFGSYDNGLFCLNRKNGYLVWERNDLKRPIGLYTTPDSLYLIRVNGEIYRLDMRTGDTIWKTLIGKDADLFGPVLYDNLIAIGVGNTVKRGVMLLNKDDGKIIDLFPIVSGLSAPPDVTEDGIYATSNGGFLYKFK